MSYSGNMRRNNMNNQMPAMSGRGGPLMTDHLQDLELELELLKRKRQLIQRQQSSMLYDRPSGSVGGGLGGSLGGGLGGSLLDDMRFNQPSQSFNDRFNEPQHLNFSHLYNDNPRNNQAFGLKRQAQSDWSGSPGNNMGSQKRSRPNPFVQPFQNNAQQNFQQPGFMPQPLLSASIPKPLMNFPVQRNRPANRPNKQEAKPKPHHPNFKQNKSANRPSGPANRSSGPANRPNGPANRPNGPANRPAGPANRSAGVANRSAGPANRPAGPANRPAGPFTPNKSPGFTSKKNVTPKKAVQNNSSENTPNSTKNVLMANKRPNNKMNGRLELTLGMIVKEMKVTYENQPEYKGVFSHPALTRLMKQGVRERLHSAMIGKVVDKAADIMAEYRQKFPLATDKEIMDLAVVEQKKNDENLEIAITLLEEGDPEQYFKKNMIKLLQVRFDEMMGKLEKIITDENVVTVTEILENLPEINKEPQATTARSETEKTAVIESANEDTANAETTQANGETAAPNADTTAETAAEETKTSDETAKADEETPAKENDNPPADISTKESMYDKWLSLYLQRKLPGLLNRHKSNFLKVLDLDKMFSNTKAAIIINANNKAQAMKAAQKNDNEQSKDDPELPRNLPYFAKVLAVPSMPKRKIMQEFLNQFTPKTIKRHKKNYNLLFIGFDSKENYDKILAANQTTLGNATLSIMGNVTKTTPEQSYADIDQVITPQLDDQINDLLTSIRNADEETKGDDSVADIDLTLNDSQEETFNNEGTDNTATTETENTAVVTEDTENSEVIEGNGNSGVDAANGADNKSDDIQVIESSEENVVTIEDDEVAPLKKSEPATPAKGRAPATPRSVNTRRSSRIQN